MPTYTFYIYPASLLVFNAGTEEFELDSGYDASDRFRIDVTDDDAVMNAGGDPNQLATVYDTDGNVIGSGVIVVPAYAEIDDGAGGSIFIDRVEVDGVHYGYTSNVPLTPGSNYPLIFSDTFEENHAYYQSNSTPCFGSETLIDTPSGPTPIRLLKPGDQVLTYDHGAQPILWAGHQTFSHIQAAFTPACHPIRVTMGHSGHAQPTAPLILSQQHRILIAHPMVELLTSHQQVFVPAGAVDPPTPPAGPVIWYHILLPEHEVIRANGVWVESLFAGPALPDLLTPDHMQTARKTLKRGAHRTTARPCLRRHEALVLLGNLRAYEGSETRNIRVA